MRIIEFCFIFALFAMTASFASVIYDGKTAIMPSGTAQLKNSIDGNTLTDCGGLDGLFECGMILDVDSDKEYPISGKTIGSSAFVRAESWETWKEDVIVNNPYIVRTNTLPNGTKENEYTDNISMITRDVSGWKTITSIKTGKVRLVFSRLDMSYSDLIPVVMDSELSAWIWWNASCSKKAPMNISTTANVNDYLNNQFNVTYDSDMNPDFSDLYIVNGSENTVKDYFILNKTDSSWAWLVLNSTISSSGNPQLYAYYDCSSPYSATVNKTLGDKLIGLYYLDENSTNRAQDTTGNGNTMNISGSVNLNSTTARHRSSYYFNGVSGYVSSGANITGFNSSNPYTVCEWIYPVSFGTQSILWGTYVTEGAFSTFVDWYSNNIRVYGTGGFTYPYAANSQWFHMCAVFNGTSSELFINGTSKATGNIGSMTYNNRYEFGGRSSGNVLEGNIDEVMIYNYALSAADVVKLYAASAEPIYILGAEETGDFLSVSMVSPENITYTTNAIQLNFTLNSSFASASCSQMLNGSYSDLGYTVNDSLRVINLTIPNGYHNMSVNCTNGTASGTSSTVWFTVNYTAPVVSGATMLECSAPSYIPNQADYAQIACHPMINGSPSTGEIITCQALDMTLAEKQSASVATELTDQRIYIWQLSIVNIDQGECDFINCTADLGGIPTGWGMTLCREANAPSDYLTSIQKDQLANASATLEGISGLNTSIDSLNMSINNLNVTIEANLTEVTDYIDTSLTTAQSGFDTNVLLVVVAVITIALSLFALMSDRLLLTLLGFVSLQYSIILLLACLGAGVYMWLRMWR
jgi:hypothetical protein